jgi:hypothetical protein
MNEISASLSKRNWRLILKHKNKYEIYVNMNTVQTEAQNYEFRFV